MTPLERDDQLKQQILAEIFLRHFLLSAIPTLDEWADKEFYLPQEASEEYGRWKTDRFPFLRKIMRLLSFGTKLRQLVIMKGAQLGITTLCIAWKLYKSLYDPGPFSYMQKTLDATKAYVKEKLDPHIRSCPAVYHTLGKGKPKEYADSWDLKAYPGGFIALGNANSDSFLRSSSIGDAVADEEDTYELTVGKQGSPVLMLAKRMVNFPGSVLVRPSTPVHKELSTIEPAFLAYTQERYYLPCPYCNPKARFEDFMFWIEWNQIKWSKEINKKTLAPKKVWLECPNCAGPIEERKHKTWMLKNGEWFSEKEGSRIIVPDDTEYRSMHISSFYSPLGFYSWFDAVRDWLSYLDDRDINKLQVFINQTKAETFYLQGNEISHSYLHQRREAYADNTNAFEVPNGAYCLTAGVDVQDDRLECEVVGWGKLGESWSIDYVVLPGDTSVTGDASGMLPDGRPSVWRLLDEYLYKKFKHQCGVELPIEMTMIDSGGHRTPEVHLFCRLRENRNIYPLRGDPGWGKGLYKRMKRRHEKYGTITHYAYVDELKSRVYANLQVSEPGPGYCHFPKSRKYGDAYFKGLTCETKKPFKSAGRTKLRWEKPAGARNEPLDCRVYAMVAFLAYPVDIHNREKLGLQNVFGDRKVIKLNRNKKMRRASKGIE